MSIWRSEGTGAREVKGRGRSRVVAAVSGPTRGRMSQRTKRGARFYAIMRETSMPRERDVALQCDIRGLLQDDEKEGLARGGRRERIPATRVAFSL